MNKLMTIALLCTVMTACNELPDETTPSTCVGIYDNGQPCDQEYDPNYVPPEEDTTNE